MGEKTPKCIVCGEPIYQGEPFRPSPKSKEYFHCRWHYACWGKEDFSSTCDFCHKNINEPDKMTPGGLCGRADCNRGIDALRSKMPDKMESCAQERMRQKSLSYRAALEEAAVHLRDNAPLRTMNSKERRKAEYRGDSFDSQTTEEVTFILNM